GPFDLLHDLFAQMIERPRRVTAPEALLPCDERFQVVVVEPTQPLQQQAVQGNGSRRPARVPKLGRKPADLGSARKFFFGTIRNDGEVVVAGRAYLRPTLPQQVLAYGFERALELAVLPIVAHAA